MLSSRFARRVCLAVWCALAASPASGAPASPTIVVGAAENFYGDNVHLWYDPATIPKVAQVILDALVQIDPGSATSYRNRYQGFQASLAPLNHAIAGIKAQYGGAPVACTEPVFGYMAAALGLVVLTPLSFEKAIEEGEDPPAPALAKMEDHLRQHQVKVLLYNTQTVSPITTRVQQLAQTEGVPVVGVSETKPPGKTV